MFEQRRVCLCILDILLRFVADGNEADADWNVAHGFRTAVGGSIRVQEHPCFLLVVLHA